MSRVPVFVYLARPTTKVHLQGLFERGPLKELLEKPGSLRYAGWGLETQEEARIIKGEYLEVALGDWKTLQLYEDGMLIAKVKADADFLAWGSRSDEGFEKRPRLNPLALIEFTYSFVDVFRRVLEHAVPQPAACVLHVSIQNTFRAEERLYLNPYGLETMAHLIDQTRYRAPEDTGELEIQMDTALIRDNTPRAAYRFVERIYLWFGVPSDQIPYVTGVGDAKVIDVDMLRRGGKPEQP
jgi:hypothetical protein